jgi:NitT/TauT family transport system permease protein
MKETKAFCQIKNFFRRYYSIFLILLVWEIIGQAGFIHPVLLPPVSKILVRFFRLLFFEKLLYHTGQSMFRMWMGFGLAALVGIPLGIVMARFAFANTFFEPLLTLGFPIPKIGIYPALIILFGVIHLSKIALIFIESVFPIAMATFNGALFVDQKLIWSAQSMGTKKQKILWKVVFPSTLPHIFIGLRIGLIVSLIVVFLSEMISSSEGLGHLMMLSSRFFKSSDMFVSIGVISLLGLLFDRLLLVVRWKTLKWHTETELH